MRKLLAMTMTATLLIISGVPMSPAKECAMPMKGGADPGEMHAVHGGMPAAGAGQKMQGMHAMHGSEAPMQHEHASASTPVQRQAEIKAECCCSFHGLIDSLPHLLAPHMTSEISALSLTGSENSAIDVESAWLVRKTPIPLPPPELLS